MKNILVAGNTITAELILGYLKYDRRYKVAGLVVDDEYVSSSSIKEYKSYGISGITKNFGTDDFSIIMGIGYSNLNQSRADFFFKLKDLGYSIETYVHEPAKIFNDNNIGEGSIILSSAIIEPHVKVGINSCVCSNVILAHHSTIGDHNWIASGTVVSGQAKILDKCFIGVNSTIINEVTIGNKCIIGGAAMISKSTKDNTVFLNRSAEPLRFDSNDYIKHFKI